MKCRSCNFEISPELKHAIAQNVCPSCGNQIMDEELLALIEDLEQTISSEVALREGTVRKLATALAFKYEISPLVQRKDHPRQHRQELSTKEVVTKEVEDTDIINVSKMEGIDPKMREQIFEQAVREKYNMVDQAAVVATAMDQDESIEDEHATMANVLSQLGTKNRGGGLMSDSELDGNPRLEQERLLRLAKQQQALKSGSGSVRRSG